MRKGVVLSDGGMRRVTLTLIWEGKTRLRRVVGFCSTSFLSRSILGEGGGTFWSFTLFVRSPFLFAFLPLRVFSVTFQRRSLCPDQKRKFGTLWRADPTLSS